MADAPYTAKEIRSMAEIYEGEMASDPLLEFAKLLEKQELEQWIVRRVKNPGEQVAENHKGAPDVRAPARPGPCKEK